MSGDTEATGMRECSRCKALISAGTEQCRECGARQIAPDMPLSDPAPAAAPGGPAEAQPAAGSPDAPAAGEEAAPAGPEKPAPFSRSAPDSALDDAGASPLDSEPRSIDLAALSRADTVLPLVPRPRPSALLRLGIHPRRIAFALLAAAAGLGAGYLLGAPRELFEIYLAIAAFVAVLWGRSSALSVAALVLFAASLALLAVVPNAVLPVIAFVLAFATAPGTTVSTWVSYSLICALIANGALVFLDRLPDRTLAVALWGGAVGLSLIVCYLIQAREKARSAPRLSRPRP